MTFDGLLVFHFVQSVVMTLAGVAALMWRKGSVAHRFAGNTYAALALTLIATGVALIILRPASFLQGWVAMSSVYLVFTGWATARERRAGPLALSGAVLGGVLALAAVPLVFRELAVPDPGDRQGVIGILLIAGFLLWFTLLDVLVIRRGGLAGPNRTARHLWRMGVSLLIVAGSATAARPEYYPQVLRPVLFAPMVLVAIAVVYFLVRTLWRRRRLAAA